MLDVRQLLGLRSWDVRTCVGGNSIEVTHFIYHLFLTIVSLRFPSLRFAVHTYNSGTNGGNICSTSSHEAVTDSYIQHRYPGWDHFRSICTKEEGNMKEGMKGGRKEDKVEHRKRKQKKRYCFSSVD